MKSLLYFKKPGGRVQIHDSSAHESIIEGSSPLKQPQLDLKKDHKETRLMRVMSAPSSAATVTSLGQSNSSGRTQDWLNEKAIKELQNYASKECQAARRLYSPLLQTETTFVKELEDFLAEKEFSDLRRKEIQHKKWTDQVYEPIRKKILETVDESDQLRLDYLRRAMYQQYLEHVNRRGFVFLRDDDKTEYFARCPVSMKAKTGTLSDPIRAERQMRDEEDSTILRCMTGHKFTGKNLEQVRLPHLPTRRYPSAERGLDVPCNSIELLPLNDKRMHRRQKDTTQSSFCLNSWAQIQNDPKVVAEELQIPRKRMFVEQPPFGRPPVSIPHLPFIDPEDFADKIVNTNPFPQHMANLREEFVALEQMWQQQQGLEQEPIKETINFENIAGINKDE